MTAKFRNADGPNKADVLKSAHLITLAYNAKRESLESDYFEKLRECLSGTDYLAGAVDGVAERMAQEVVDGPAPKRRGRPPRSNPKPEKVEQDSPGAERTVGDETLPPLEPVRGAAHTVEITRDSGEVLRLEGVDYKDAKDYVELYGADRVRGKAET